MGNERVELDERSWVEQEIETLACRQFAGVVLSLDPGRPTAEQGLRAHLVEPAESFVVRRQGVSSTTSLCKDMSIIEAGATRIATLAARMHGFARRPRIGDISTETVNNWQMLWITGVRHRNAQGVR
jgi:hypothetical protein